MLVKQLQWFPGSWRGKPEPARPKHVCDACLMTMCATHGHYRFSTQLYQKGVPPVMIAQLSGHKNTNSLSHYTTASEQQQREMCNILQNVAGVHSSASRPICPPSEPTAAASGAAVAIPDPFSVPQAPPQAQAASTVQHQLLHASGLMSMLSNANIHGNITFNINFNNPQ